MRSRCSQDPIGALEAWYRCSRCGQLVSFARTRPVPAFTCAGCGAHQPCRAVPMPVGGRAMLHALRESPVPVLVAFMAAGCGPCRDVAAELDRWAQVHAGSLIVLTVDTGRHPQAAAGLGVHVVPTLCLWHQRQPIAQAEGARDLGAVQDALQAVMERAGLRKPVTSCA